MVTLGQPNTTVLINGPVDTQTTGIEVLSTSFPYPLSTFANFVAGLPVATTPLSGTELVVAIQGGVAKQIPISTILAGAAGVRPQRSIVSSGGLPIVVADSILNLNAATDLVPIVPAFGTRNGAALTFKNLPGSHVQTLTRTSPDTFDGQTTYTLEAGASVTLVPFNDGVNTTGYAIE